MNTIFSDFSKDVDLSIFKKDNEDPKTPLRRHYLSLVGLLEYVDILNGDLPGISLPDSITEESVNGMIIQCIGDLDTRKAMSTSKESSLPEHDYIDLGLPSSTQGTQGTEGTQSTQGTEGTQSNEGTQSTQGTQGTEGTQGA